MSAAPEPLLSIRGLKTWFDTEKGLVKAIDGIDLDIAPGQTVALVGESGSGKSMTALSILGLVPRPVGRIEAGSIHFEGTDLVRLPEEKLRDIRGNRISMIFQEPMTSLNPVFRIGHQIASVIRLHQGGSKDAAWAQAVELLDRVGIPEPARNALSYPHEFSGGMNQRAMIAMALACRPRLLIADEPTTALDVTVQAQILRLLRTLQEEIGMAVLLITHDLGIVAEMADEVFVMQQGKIVEHGGVHAIYKSPQEPYTQKLLAAVPRIDLSPAPGPPAGNGKAATPPPLIEVTNLEKYFPIRKGVLRRTAGFVKAVDGISFTIPKGKTVALVGESGSGKTTAGRTILRLLEPTGGTIHFDGREVTGLAREGLRSLRKRMQIIFQDPFGSLNPRISVQAMLSEILFVHNIGEKNSRRDRVAELLRTVELPEDAMYRFPHEFSGGQRQRLAIARALAVEPDFIVADEAVSALDVTIRAQILALLSSLQEKLGLTYLFITHDLGVTQQFCDSVVVMHRGQIVEQGDTDSVFRAPQHPYTQRLLDAVPLPDPDARRIRQD